MSRVTGLPGIDTGLSRKRPPPRQRLPVSTHELLRPALVVDEGGKLPADAQAAAVHDRALDDARVLEQEFGGEVPEQLGPRRALAIERREIHRPGQRHRLGAETDFVVARLVVQDAFDRKAR